jgi:hypothetical protein
MNGHGNTNHVTTNLINRLHKINSASSAPLRENNYCAFWNNCEPLKLSWKPACGIPFRFWQFFLFQNSQDFWFVHWSPSIPIG